MAWLIRSVLLSLLLIVVVRALRDWWAGGPQPRSGGQGRATASPPPRSSGPSPYEVLGVSPQASQEEVRRAYQKLVQQYHPDQVSHLGAELREVAERRTKEINAAYNQLKRS